MRLTKRLLSAFLVLVMVFSMLPLQAFASEVHTEDGGGMKLPVQGAKPIEAQEEVAARVELNESSAMISVGNTFTFVPTLFSDQGEQMESKMDFKWESSNPEVATVENGAVTGVAEGLATITCSYGDLQTTAIVSVTKATYQLTYEIDYPDDAKKVAYQNGGKATIITPQDTRITVSCEPGKTVAIASDLASTINYQLTGFTDGEKQYQVGESIAVSTNMTLKSCWTPIEGAGSEGSYETINVTYRSNDKSVTKEVTAFVLPDERYSRRGTATFITANNNDTIATSDRTMCGWTINNVAYGLNQQVTVPVSRDTLVSKWTVDAYARYETVTENEAYAEFFVRKSDKVNEVGFGKDKYFSIGSRKIKIDPKWDTSTRIDGAEVAKYLLDPPTAEEVANLMNESLPAGAVVDWNHLSKLGTGFHVDGVIRTAGKYWNVKFIDPDNNRCVQQVPVLDEDKISTIYDGSRLNTNVRTFIGWSFQQDGKPIDNLSGKTVNGDITLYALFDRKPAYTVRAKLYVGTPNDKAELLTEKVETDLTFDQLKAMYKQSCSELATHFWKGVGQSGMHGDAYWTPKKSADPNRQSPQEHIVKLYLKEGEAPNVTVTLTYDGNGEGKEVTGVPGVEKTIKGESVQISSATPTCTGYTFKGWYLNKAGTGEKYGDKDGGKPGATTITLNGNTTLYAKWEANTATYTVKHYQETETAGVYPSEPVETVTSEAVPIGSVIELTKVTKSYNGYVLDKYEPANDIEIGPNPAANVIKVYYKRSTYTVTYKVDDKQYGEPHTVRYGTQHTLISEPPQDAGHSFSGWSVTSGNATIQTGADGKSYITMPADNVTIEGNVTLKKFLVSYAYGTGNEYDYEKNGWNLPESHDVDYDATDFLKEKPATPEGYNEFIGWYKDEACTKEFTSADTMPANHVTAYGKFTKRQDISYTVRYLLKDSNIPVGIGSKTEGNKTFEEVVTETAPDVDGYTLVGPTTQELKLTANNKSNVITFYYYKNITVTANSTSKDYGAPVPELEATVRDDFGKNVDNISYSLSTTATQDSPVKEGGYPIEVTGDEVQGYYKVTFVPGTLTIKPAESLSVQPVSYEGVYDGQSHSGEAAVFVNGEKFTDATVTYYVCDSLNGPWEKLESYPTIKDVDEFYVMVVAEHNNYNTAVDYAHFQVTPKAVTIRAPQPLPVMYGQAMPVLAPTVEPSVQELPDDFYETVDYDMVCEATSTSPVVKGGYPIYFTRDGQTVEGQVKYGDYDVNFIPGKLIITEADGLSVSAKGGSWTYDGEFHGDVDVDVNLPDAKLTYSTDGVNYTEDVPTIRNVSESGKTFYVKASLDNYVEKTATYTLTVNPRVVTITAPENVSAVYGQTMPVLAPTVAPTVQELPDDFYETVDYDMVCEATSTSPAGEYPISFTRDGQTVEDLVKYGNYDVNFIPGKLIITEADGLSISAKGGSWTYDGEFHGDVDVDVNLPGATLTYSTDGVNYAEDAPTIKDVSESGKTFYVKASLANYKDEIAEYTLTVTPKLVTVTSASGEKVYDGTPLTAGMKSETGWVGEEGAEYTFHASVTDVTTGNGVPNIFSYKAKEGTDLNNYVIKMVNGTLKVNPRVVTVTAPQDAKATYGEEISLSEEAFENLPDNLVQDFGENVRYTMTVDAQKDSPVDSYPIYFVDGAGNAINPEVGDNRAEATVDYGNYLVTFKPGKLTILAAPVTITVPNGTKTYGEGNPELAIEVMGLVNGNDLGDITYRRTSTVDNAGIYTDDLWPVYTENPNYTVTEVPGTLTILAAPVTITVPNGTKTYGEGNPELTMEVKGLVKENDLGEITYRRTSETELVGVYADDLWPVYTVNPNYTVTEIPGTLTIEAPAPGKGTGIVTKTHENKTYNPGDEVVFTISATNIYNQPATLTIVEQLEKVVFDKVENVTMAPGETLTFEARYTVTEEDILADHPLINTIDWTIVPNEGSSIGGTVIDDVKLAGRNSAMTVEKTIVDQKDSYRVGDVISFQILVKNTGNVTLHNLELTDRLINVNGSVTFTETNGASLSGGKLLLAQLAPGQQWTVKCSYTVTEADAGKNIGNAATVTPEDGPTRTDETDDPASVEQLYTLTIRYLNTAGVSIHEDYTGRYHAGDRYEIASPAVAGYTLTADSVIRSGVMGEGDKTLVVVYDRVPDPEPDPDPAPGPGVPAPAPGPNPDPDADPAQQTEPQDNTEPVLQPGTYLEDPENHTLTPIDEDETPLANVNLNGHTCCILHFLLMLAAMVVYGFDTKSRKKHQTRIFELKRQLAMKDDQNDSQQS